MTDIEDLVNIVTQVTIAAMVATFQATMLFLQVVSQQIQDRLG
jgi:hypothetical protein